MKIEIKNRRDNKVIICGEYENIKDCLEKNRDADLRGAYFGNVNLEDAYLAGVNLEGAYLEGAYLVGAYLVGTNLRGVNFRGADLRGVDFRGAYLRDADLEVACLQDANFEGAYLEKAKLEGAKSYSRSHDFWAEIIRRQELETFTEKEWAIIGQVYIHRFCWSDIKKRYGKKIMPIFKKLAKAGFSEWEEVYKVKLK